MRFCILLCTYVSLIVVDRVSTWIAIDSDLGKEINPHVNTESLASIFLSPVPLAASGLFFLFLVLAEKYSDTVHSLLARRHPLAPICLLPLFFVWMMTFICINNILGVLGFLTILTWFSTLFSVFTKDPFLQLGIAMNILNIAGLPLLARIALRIYAPKQSIETKL